MPSRKPRKKAAPPVAKVEGIENAETTKKRKQIRPSRKAPDDNYNDRERLVGAAVGRYMMENATGFRAILRAFEHGAIGTGPKITVNTGDDWGKEASGWFNHDWQKWCDGRDDYHFGEICALLSNAEKATGDCLIVFDDFLNNDGTLLFFDADQLPTIEEKAWKTPPDGWGGMSQSKGVIYDKMGRVHGYVTSPNYAEGSAKIEDCTLIPAWHVRRNPEGSAKLYKRPWRFNQRRGEGDSWIIADTMRDVQSMISSELNSAKLAAKMFAWIKSDPGSEAAVERAMQAANISQADMESILYGTGSDADGDLGSTGSLAKLYKAIEDQTDGATEYLNPGEEVQVYNNERPGGNVSLFGEHMQINAGAAMGLGRSRATGKADSSYTAYRGEELMTWETFRVEQKRLERRAVDFCVYKAITWAVENRELDRPTDADWFKKVSVAWPKMVEVDPIKSAMAERMFLKNGTLDFSKILGPNWKEILGGLSDQLTFIREKDLPLSMFETVSGAEVKDDE